MVEINNQRKAFLDMLAWSEGTDQRTSENQKSWLWRHCGRRAIYWLLRSPSQTCHLAAPKLKSTGAGRYQLHFPVGGMPTQRQLEKALRKVRTLWHYVVEAWRFTYDWSWWYPSGNRPLQQYLEAAARRWLWSVRAWADSLIAKFKARRNGQRDWCMSSHRDYLRSGYLHHRLPV